MKLKERYISVYATYGGGGSCIGDAHVDGNKVILSCVMTGFDSCLLSSTKEVYAFHTWGKCNAFLASFAKGCKTCDIARFTTRKEWLHHEW